MTVATKPFVISRVLEAPRALVWKAWTEAERLMQQGWTGTFDQLARDLAKS